MVGEVNKYVTDTEPFKLKGEAERERLGTVLHVARAGRRATSTRMLAPVPAALRQRGARRRSAARATFMPMPRIEEVEDLDDGAEARYPVITGDYSATPRWESRPVVVGAPVDKPTPIFTKLDASVVEEELARLAGDERDAGADGEGVTRPVAAGHDERADRPRPAADPGRRQPHPPRHRPRRRARARRRGGHRAAPRRSASTGWCRSAATSPGARLTVEVVDEHPALLGGVALHPNEAPRLAERGEAGRGLRRDRGARGAPPGPGGRRDRARLLPHRARRRWGATGLVPLAHRPGQAHRQGPADPRPRRPRRRAADPRGGGGAGADGAALLLRRRRDGARAASSAATTSRSPGP